MNGRSIKILVLSFAAAMLIAPSAPAKSPPERPGASKLAKAKVAAKKKKAAKAKKAQAARQRNVKVCASVASSQQDASRGAGIDTSPNGIDTSPAGYRWGALPSNICAEASQWG